MEDMMQLVVVVGAVILAILVAVAPLACWIVLARIHRTLQDRLPADGARVEYQLGKQTQVLLEIQRDGMPVDVRSVKKSETQRR